MSSAKINNMASSKSFEMQPNNDDFTRIFFKSQFCTPTKLPKDIDVSGKVAIVTGANIGLGFYCCRHLLSLKLSRLIIAVRSVKKGEDAASKLRTQFPGTRIEVWALEMSSYESIQSFVCRAEKDLGRLDIVILNAGIVRREYNVVESTGHEQILQVNYLSTVLLSIFILPVLKTKSLSSAPGRLTIVGSGVALGAKFPNRDQIPLLKSFDNPAEWDPQERYWSSKLLGHYFMVKLVKYVDPKDVIVNIVDPGLCKGSGLLRDATGLTAIIMAILTRVFGRNLEVGSSTYVDATLVKGKESHGCFVMDWKIRPFAALLYASDSNTVTEKLWNETMKELEFAGALRILEGLK